MSEQGTLTGRAVVVTGASSGIGQAIALAMARAGADVAVTYRVNAHGAQETAASISALGRRSVALQVDLANGAAGIRAMGDAARSALGGLDVWVNNAGADILTGEGDTLSDLEKLDLLLTVDLRGTMLASWEAVALLDAQPRGGAIINMSWDHVLTGMEGRNPQMYSAVKGGILSFSKSLARSVAPRIRVNVLAPGWIETAFGSNLDEARRQAVAASTPLGRWGTPEDVAGAAVFLASPAASFMTGQMMMIGGGIVM
jgi:3-oxoacyl-[acyl-carrier protein] reductase